MQIALTDAGAVAVVPRSITVGGYDDYPELYTRWFEYGSFLPMFRTHGGHKFNDVWTYGKAAERILVKYLKLRYQLLPYNYSLGYRAYETGAPFLRALFMDFPNDPMVANIGDEYMWTNECVHGGQTVKVDAPIDTLPLFVCAGSLIPLGEVVENTSVPQRLIEPGQEPRGFQVYDGSELPEGEWTVSDVGPALTLNNRFPKDQVSRCTARWTGKTENSLSLGIWSAKHTLAPGETLKLEADYGILTRGS